MDEHANKMKRLQEEIDRLRQMEEARVRSLGNDIGFGRVMQLAEKIWDEERFGVHIQKLQRKTLIASGAAEAAGSQKGWHKKLKKV